MNAAIRAVVRTALANGLTVKGINRGYSGLLEEDIIDMDARSVSDIIQRGGTKLYTARCKEMMTKKGQDKAAEICKNHGIDGIVVHLGKCFKNFVIENNQITCEAGLSLIELAKVAAQNGLTGFEFMSGIPGSLGGGLKMNAGAYGSDMSQIVTRFKVMDTQGQIHEIDPKKNNFFAYRHSELPTGWIFVEATMLGAPKDQKIIFETMENLKQKRIQTQPQKVRTAGSTFKNPPNIPAWKLIDAAGLRGYTYKGAKMSEKHSNFMINEDKATATTLEELAEFVRATVAAKTGQQLEWEVERIGKRK